MQVPLVKRIFGFLILAFMLVVTIYEASAIISPQPSDLNGLNFYTIKNYVNGTFGTASNTITITGTGVYNTLSNNKLSFSDADYTICKGNNIIDDVYKSIKCSTVCLSTDNQSVCNNKIQSTLISNKKIYIDYGNYLVKKQNITLGNNSKYTPYLYISNSQNITIVGEGRILMNESGTQLSGILVIYNSSNIKIQGISFESLVPNTVNQTNGGSGIIISSSGFVDLTGITVKHFNNFQVVLECHDSEVNNININHGYFYGVGNNDILAGGVSTQARGKCSVRDISYTNNLVKHDNNLSMYFGGIVSTTWNTSKIIGNTLEDAFIHAAPEDTTTAHNNVDISWNTINFIKFPNANVTEGWGIALNYLYNNNQYNKIDHNTIINFGGIAVYNSSKTSISFNIVDKGLAADNNLAECFKLVTNSHDVDIDYNKFYNCDNIDILISENSTDNTFVGNYFQSRTIPILGALVAIEDNNSVNNKFIMNFFNVSGVENSSSSSYAFYSIANSTFFKDNIIYTNTSCIFQLGTTRNNYYEGNKLTCNGKYIYNIGLYPDYYVDNFNYTVLPNCTINNSLNMKNIFFKNTTSNTLTKYFCNAGTWEILTTDWNTIKNFPVACPAGTFISLLNSSVTCSTPSFNSYTNVSLSNTTSITNFTVINTGIGSLVTIGIDSLGIHIRSGKSDYTPTSRNLTLGINPDGTLDVIKIDTNRNTYLLNLTGSGNQYLCVDSSGKIYRNTTCA